MSARILVTGATGFVGGHLAEALVARGFGVRALVRPSSPTARLAALGAERVEAGGLDDAAALARAVEGVDVVLHLAAATHARTAADYERVNADGTRALVDAVVGAKAPPRRLVYLSSLAAVGPSFDGRPVDREATPHPLTTYGRTKLAGERACLAARDRVEVVALRAAAVYGPGDRELLRLFRIAARGVLPVPRGPARPVQLVHVADLTDALVRGATAPEAAGIYHVADARAYAWEEVARLIARGLGRRARVVRIPQAALRAAAATSEWLAARRGRSTVFNREKAEELLAPGWLCETEAFRRDAGFEAKIALPEGLAETAEWYRAHGWL